MSRFLTRLRRGPLLMDGAMGTELARAGLSLAEGCERWNLVRPDVVRAIHENYLAAGAECLVTNTFQNNPSCLDRHGLRTDLERIGRTAVMLARSAAGPERFVLASVGPVADPNEVHEAVRGLEEADAILLETWSGPEAFVAADLLAGRPVLLSVTYHCHPDGRIQTLSGHDPEWFAQRAASHGLLALGVNCGRDVGLAKVIAVLERYRNETQLPLLARPNAGTPGLIDGTWHYPLTPEQLAVRVPDLVAAGATLIGGCCGTTPAHVAAVKQALG